MAVLPAAPELTVNPRVSGELFLEHPNEVFWLGEVASHGEVSNPEIFEGLLKLRGNVYVHELSFLTADHLDDLGREMDEYDDRSVHFAAVQNNSPLPGDARIVGSLRLITKDDAIQPYPIETYFPELFAEPVNEDSAEVSRFIARFPEDPGLTQHMISLALIRAAALYAQKERIADYYCVIEKPLLRLLGKIGIPLEAIGEPKDVPEQGGILYPVRIDAMGIVDSVTSDKTGSLQLGPFFEQEAENHGTGFYDQSLTGGKL